MKRRKNSITTRAARDPTARAVRAARAASLSHDDTMTVLELKMRARALPTPPQRARRRLFFRARRAKKM